MKLKEQKICIDCGKIGVKERKRCEECAKIHNRKRAKEYYKRRGKKVREEKLEKGICIVCGDSMIMWKKDQLKHSKCKQVYRTIDHYNNAPRDKKGNTISNALVSTLLGFKLPKGFIVHHVDENPFNNNIENLWIMTISSHASLHSFLRRERSLYLKKYGSNPENCWNILRDQFTTTWLETTSVKVLKAIDIGQSASEPLSSFFNEYEEGSETMHRESKSLNGKIKI